MSGCQIFESLSVPDQNPFIRHTPRLIFSRKINKKELNILSM